MFDVLIATPTGGHCKPQYVFNLVQLLNYISYLPIRKGLDRQGFEFQYVEGSNLLQNRERLVLQALEGNKTHILFIDDDMGFDPRALPMLASRNKPIVGCNYRRREPPANFICHRRGIRIPTTADSSGLELVDCIGFGFILIETDIFKRMPPPWFAMEWVSQDHYLTEDVYFIHKAAQFNIPTFVDHDASKLVWHMGNLGYNWKDDYSNLNSLFKEQQHGTKSSVESVQST